MYSHKAIKTNMSKELVSLSHDRSAWNSLQGLETRHHDDKLTAEQAANINRSFDVFVVPVRHGYGTDIDPNAIENGNAPSHESYLQVEEIIDEMRPGDRMPTGCRAMYAVSSSPPENLWI